MNPSSRPSRGRVPPLRMPLKARWELQDRLRRHEKKWEVREIYFFVWNRPAAAYVRIGFTDPRMDVDGADWMDLCRLEWTGTMERWRLALPRLGGRGYDPAHPPLGTEGGIPEVCVDAALEVRMGWDPLAPGEELAIPRRLERLLEGLKDLGPGSQL